jgi:hypothetical protein
MLRLGAAIFSLLGLLTICLPAQVSFQPELAYSVRRHTPDESPHSLNLQISFPGSNTNTRKAISTWDLSRIELNHFPSLNSATLRLSLWNSFGVEEFTVRVFAVVLPGQNADGKSSLTTVRSWNQLGSDGWHGLSNNTGFASSSKLNPVEVGVIRLNAGMRGESLDFDLPLLASFLREKLPGAEKAWIGLGFSTDVEGANFMLAREGQGPGIALILE